MAFVLACAIATTMLIAFSKRWSNQRKLCRYESVFSPTDKSCTPLAADVEAQYTTAPFGIRAIQSGIEVEGVWVSPGSTPLSSRPGSIVSPALRTSPQASPLLGQMQNRGSLSDSVDEGPHSRKSKSFTPLFAPRVMLEEIGAGAQSSASKGVLPSQGGATLRATSEPCLVHLSPARPCPGQQKSLAPEEVVELDAIERHRLSQCASSGQLVPRFWNSGLPEICEGTSLEKEQDGKLESSQEVMAAAGRAQFRQLLPRLGTVEQDARGEVESRAGAAGEKSDAKAGADKGTAGTATAGANGEKGNRFTIFRAWKRAKETGEDNGKGDGENGRRQNRLQKKRHPISSIVEAQEH